MRSRGSLFQIPNSFVRSYQTKIHGQTDEQTEIDTQTDRQAKKNTITHSIYQPNEDQEEQILGGPKSGTPV